MLSPQLQLCHNLHRLVGLSFVFCLKLTRLSSGALHFSATSIGVHQALGMAPRPDELDGQRTSWSSVRLVSRRR